jgi:glycosyltransferase involved in cell wall biosynthesis
MLEIAIPTYNRPTTLKKKTLKLLDAFNKNLIKIYVEDEDEKEKYINELGEEYTIIVTNTIGIGAKRNYIKTLTKADWLLQIDDDISAILDINGLPLSSLAIKEMIYIGFNTTDYEGARLWGINSYSNNFYFKRNLSRNLKFIIGAFHGTIMKGEPVLTPMNTMEDYYNTCRHFKEDGLVCRFNMYGLKTKFATEKGGLQSLLPNELRTTQEDINATRIVNIFGESMVKKVKKKRGTDLRLNPFYKNPS